ncbi:MAG: hypothetical protein R3F59_23690 [Myxococcota bacterium]
MTPFLTGFSEALIGRLVAADAIEIAPADRDRVVLYVANWLGTRARGGSLLSSVEAALLACPEVGSSTSTSRSSRRWSTTSGRPPSAEPPAPRCGTIPAPSAAREPALSSPLRTLPLTRWATRFSTGSLAVRGRLDAPFHWPELTVPAGPVTLDVAFRGGAQPVLTSVRIQGAGEATVDVSGVASPGRAVEALLDALHDLEVIVEAQPGEDLWVRMMPGLSALIPGDAPVHAEAHSIGPPDRPRLSRPLVVSFGGAGLSVRLPGARWVKILAAVAIRRASLAPDGAVELDGSGFGLRRASHHLSDLVRRHPHFARVRSFLADREP